MIRQVPETAARRAKLGYELTLEEINAVREIWRARLNALENSDNYKPAEVTTARWELHALDLEELRQLRLVAAELCVDAQSLAFLASQFAQSNPQVGRVGQSENVISAAGGVFKQAQELTKFITSAS